MVSARLADPGVHLLRPWLFGVAFRIVRAHRRRRARETLHAELDSEDGASSPEGWLQDRDLRALLSAALQRVLPSCKSILVMHYLEDLDVIDIARRLSLTKFGVYARLYKGRKELVSALRRLCKEGVPT